MGRRITDVTVRELLREYARRADTLRQIHGNKAQRAARWHQTYVITTLVLATIVTFFGFTGTERIAAAISRFSDVSSSSVEAVYTAVVLAILVVTLLGLVFRFDERSVRHYQSVETLTEFIRDYEDLVALSQSGCWRLVQGDLDVARTRYKGILSVLPPNTDDEYLEAKEDSRKKQLAKIRRAAGSAITDVRWVNATAKTKIDIDHAEAFSHLLTQGAPLKALRVVRDSLGGDFWITGGLVREVVWDDGHDFSLPTAPDDVDVIFFDPNDTSQELEYGLRDRLVAASPNVRWSVKNEARMHLVSGDEPYSSLQDAVFKFPETATCVAVRLDEGDQLQILAPRGLTDLFDLVLRPSMKSSVPAFQRRLTEKDWTKRWPRLTVEAAGESTSA